MSIQNEKLMNLADGKILYDDLRGRIDGIVPEVSARVPKPATEGTSGQVLRTNGDGTTFWDNDVNAQVIESELSARVLKPAEEGTSGQVLRTNGNGTTFWDNDANAQDIAEAVTDWLGNNVPTGQTVAVDASLLVSGAAADSQVVGTKISDLKNKVGLLKSNIGFVSICENEGETFPVSGATDYRCVGVRNVGNVYTFNGRNTSNQDIRVRLSSSTARTNTASTANGWARTVSMVGEHRYKLEVNVISGTCANTLGDTTNYGGVYIYGSNDNSVKKSILLNAGETRNSISFIWGNAYGDSKLEYHTYATDRTYTNFTIEVNLIDLDVELRDAYDTYIKRNEIDIARLNDGEGVVKYYGNDVTLLPSSGATDSSCLGVKSIGKQFTINGTNTSSKSLFIKLSDPVTRTATDSTKNGWARLIPMVAGHKYRMSVKMISGTCTPAPGNTTYCSINMYNAASNSNLFYLILSDAVTDTYREFIWNDTYGNAMICLNAAASAVSFENFTFEVDLTDLTEKSSDVYETYIKRDEADIDQLKNCEGIVTYYGNDSSLLPVSGASDASCLGIQSVRNRFILNGTNSSGVGVRCKVSGGIARTTSNSTADAWAKTIPMIANHKYIVRFKIISGTCTSPSESGYIGVFSIYGSDVTTNKKNCQVFFNGTNEYEFDIIWGSTYGNAKIEFHATANSSYTDFTFEIELIDLTLKLAEIDNRGLTEGFVNEQRAVFNASGVIPYWGTNNGILFPTANATDGACLGIKYDGNTFCINGVNTAGTNIRLKISGGVYRTKNASTMNSFPKTVPFITGHKYRLKFTHVSGEKTGYLSTLVRNENNADIVSTSGREDVKIDFVWTDEGNGVMLLYTGTDGSYTDYTVRVELIDLSAVDVPEDDSDIIIDSKFVTEMDTTVESVHALMTEPCLVFPLVTDIHYLSVGRDFDETMKNIKYLMKNVACNGMLCLGDITDGGDDNHAPRTKADGKPIVTGLMESMSSVGNLYFTMGNHDDFRYVRDETIYWMLPEEIYSYYMSWTVREAIPDSSQYGVNYYVDFPGFKTRIICIDTNNLARSSEPRYGITNETLSWFTSTLSSMESDWIGMIITHVPLYDEVTWSDMSVPSNAGNVRNAIRNSGKTCFVLSGHTHADIAYQPANDVLNVLTGCTKFVSGVDREATTKGNLIARVYGRTRNDETQDLWDVVILRPFSKKLNMVRFGAGADRGFYLENNSVDVNETITLESELDASSWVSSNSEVATVSEGIVTGVAQGECNIVANDISGNTETFHIVVS